MCPSSWISHDDDEAALEGESYQCQTPERLERKNSEIMKGSKLTIKVKM